MKSSYLKLYIRGEYHKVKLINGKLGKWYDAAKFAPIENGTYIAILEKTSPNKECQSWAGEGIPEIVRYDTNYDTSKHGVNWTGRGSLTVAYWMPSPKFNLKWHKNNDPFQEKKGSWLEY